MSNSCHFKPSDFFQKKITLALKTFQSDNKIFQAAKRLPPIGIDPVMSGLSFQSSAISYSVIVCSFET